MNEREIEAAIRAIVHALSRPDLLNDDRRNLYGARDALEIELRRVRAWRPAL